MLLAAERRGEMGTARAIGTQRRHLVQMFLFEGAAYDVLAAAVGAVLGLALSVVMVRLIAGALSESGLVTIRYRLTWTSLLVAFSLGALLTLAVVTIAAWRVSRLNIVAAVRNLPQPPRRRRRRYGWLLAGLCVAVGALMIASAFSSKSAVALLIGGSLVLVALVPAIRSLGGSERLAYSVAGTGVLVWNLLPFSVYKALVPDLKMGFGVFVLVGLLLVAGATWVLVYNLRPMLNGVMWVFGRSRHAVPVLKTAIASPLRNRFRTGATAGLFTLVVFTLVTGAATSGVVPGLAQRREDLRRRVRHHRADLAAEPDPGHGHRARLGPRHRPGRHHGVRRPVLRADGRPPVRTRRVLRRLRRPGARRQLPATRPPTASPPAPRATTRTAPCGRPSPHTPGSRSWTRSRWPRRANWGTTAISDFRLHGFYLEDAGLRPRPGRGPRHPDRHDPGAAR